MRRVFVRAPRSRRATDTGDAEGADPPTALEAACHAPFGNLFLDPLGEARACCVADGYPLGKLSEQRLPDIWAGPRAVALREAMVEGDFSKGCGHCDWRLGAGLPSVHHAYNALPTDSLTPARPGRLEINISNACNLQCVMCNGDYSSAIRLHREGRPALPKVYGDEFFDDLADLIPHLQEVSFTGGEPFLVPEYHRIWDMIAELNPDLPVQITTNGTQWNRRVERVLGMLRCEINVSIDGFTKDTYEAVRVGADHATVFANLERFVAHGRDAGTKVQIFHCLMPQNYHELGDLLLLGDELDIGVEVLVVSFPSSCSLEAMEDWTDLRATFEHLAETVRPRLGRNAAAFDTQYRRVHDGALLAPVLGFPRISPEAPDDAALAAAGGWAPDRPPSIRLAVGPDRVITSVSPAMEAFTHVPAASLVGRPLEAFDEAMVAAYGPRGDRAGAAVGDSVATTESTYGTTRFRGAIVARRAADGWLTHAELLVFDAE